MSDSETQNPRVAPQPADSIPVDPLLDSGSFIDPDQPEQIEPEEVAPQKPETEEATPEKTGPEEAEQTDNGDFPPGVVIAAEPISMLSPDEISAGSSKTPSSATRRNPDEMAKRPEWLPEDWTIDLRVRTNGATAGLIDRYYVSPAGKKHRSKVEVMRTLGIEDTSQKRKANSAEPCGSSKKKKSSGKRKKAENIELPPAVSTEAPEEEAVSADAPPQDV